MDTASQILVVGGTCILMYGLLLGIPMIVARGRSPRPPHYLVAAHLAAIIQGGVLLALTVAVEFSVLPAGWEAGAAGALVGGIVLFDLGLTVNWLQGVKDSFAENALGGKISALGLPFVLGGAGILLVGVIAALFHV